MKSMVEVSHSFLEPVLHRQAVLLDGTLGRGQDAAFLLKRARKVIAFEIQEDVADQIEKRIGDGRLVVHRTGHEHLFELVKEPLDGAIFNFGWCPGLENGKSTHPETSLEAVKQALELLKVRGRMALVFYPHMEGEREGQIILDWLEGMDHRALPVQMVRLVNCKGSPWCLLIEKRKEGYGSF